MPRVMHRHGLVRVARITALLLLTAGAVRPAGRHSQRPPPVGTAAPGSVSMTVDFLALTRDYQPVLDLKRDEVTLKVDGKTRTLRSLTLMSVSAGSGSSSTPAGDAPPAPFATNDVSDGGHAFVLMIDDESLRVGNEQPLRDAISRFLTSLSPRDRVAVVTLPHGGLKVDFTSDPTRVRRAVQFITGQANDRETARDAAQRTRATLQELTGWLENLGGGQGPTTVVLFSSSLMGVRAAIAQISRSGTGGLVDNIDSNQVRWEDFQYVGDAVVAARVQFYIVLHDATVASAPPAAPTSTGTDSNSTRAGLENLTGITGGALLSLAGSGGDTALTRVARETASYWAATFDAEANERNGINHPLSIKVSRDGVLVRARPALPIAKPDAGVARPPPTSPHAMLLESSVYRELPIRVVGYASRSSDGQVRIMSVAEAVDPAVTLAAVEAGLFDDAGHLLKRWAPLPTDLGSNGVLGAFSGIPRGNYRLRVAAIDDAGHRGTADYDGAADLVSAGTMKLSDLVLGLSREGRFAPRLQFAAEPVALAYLEIYGGPVGARIVMRIEVARTLNGPAVLSVQPAVDEASEPGRFIVTAAIPIGALPAGDYVVRATVHLEGQPEGRVVRTLRKIGS